MKFEEIYIDGFGIFHRYRIKNLIPGLNVLVGPNEAGKSTIHTFQKRILFGFPDKRRKKNLYPPLSGGRHGGRLVVSSGKNGKIVIERYVGNSHEVKVVFSDGTTGGPPELSHLLGHANENIFENIYAFGLTELQNFDTLNNEEVKGRLYSAGTGIGAVSLIDIQKDIENDAGNLFKLQGSKPEINSLCKNIREINNQLRDLKDNVREYDELHEKLEEITRDIHEKGKQCDQIRADLYHTQNLIKVWDDYITLQDSLRTLEEIPQVEKFPEKGMDKLEGYLKKIEELQESISDKKENIQKIEAEESEIFIDERIINNKERIDELKINQGKYESAVSDLPGLTENLKKAKESLQELLREIGPDWDEDKLTQIDTSIPEKEFIRVKRDNLTEKIEKIVDAEREIKRIDRDVQITQKKKEKLEKNIEELASQQLSEKKLKEQKETLKFLRVRYTDVNRVESDVRNLQESEKSLMLQSPLGADFFSKLPGATLIIFLFSGISAALLLLLYFEYMISGITISMLTLLLSAIFFIQRQKSLRFTERQKYLSEKRENLETEVQNIRDEMLKRAGLLGFDDIPDQSSIEKKDEELQGVSESLLKLHELKNQLDSLEGDIRNYNEEADSVKKNHEKWIVEKNRAEKEWENWLVNKGLEPGLTHEGALEIFATIKTGIEKKKSIEDHFERIEEIKEFTGSFEAQIESILADCNRQRDGIKVFVELGKLAEDLEAALSNKSRMQNLEFNKKNLRLELKNLEQKLEEQEKQLHELLEQGSASHEDEFRKNASNWEERNRLQAEIFRRQQSIKKMSGEGKAYDYYLEELEETNPEILEEKRTKLEKELDETGKILDDLKNERGAIRNKIETMEQEEKGALLRMEREAKTEELYQKAEEWSVLTLSRTLMKKAVENYEKERQPGVVKEAQTFFSRMTLGNYTRIYAPLDESRIYIEDKNGNRKEIFELSRGTAEQLYLSLRFGFIREFGKRAEILPVVFDDILVNFDPARFEAACEALKELTKSNQVLYFTCHPETADSLKRIIPESKVIEL